MWRCQESPFGSGGKSVNQTWEGRVWNPPPYLHFISSRKELEVQPALEHCWTETIGILKCGFDAVTQDGSPSVRKGRHSRRKGDRKGFEQNSHGPSRETTLPVWGWPVRRATCGFVAFHGGRRQSFQSVSKDKPRVIPWPLTQHSLVTFRLWASWWLYNKDCNNGSGPASPFFRPHLFTSLTRVFQLCNKLNTDCVCDLLAII